MSFLDALRIVAMTRIIDADVEENRLVVGRGFQCMTQGHFYFIIMSDRNITALDGVGEGAPVYIAQFGAGALLVADTLAVIDAREFAVVEYAVNGAEVFTHGGECFHTAHQHGAIAENADNLLAGVDHFGGVNRWYAVAHGIET